MNNSVTKLKEIIKFIYSEKATKFCEIFPLLLTTVHTVQSKILQNFVAFSEYMNFNVLILMSVGSWSFSLDGYQKPRFLLKNQVQSKKIAENFHQKKKKYREIVRCKVYIF